MPVILLLFIIVPLIEIALFIQVGGAVGVLPTVALVVFTAVLGVGLLRWQGVGTLNRARSRMQAGEMPAREMVEGMMLLVAAVLLLTPGFFTDAVGFTLLIPASRYLLYTWFGRHLVIRGQGASFSWRGGRTYSRADDRHHTFEGEYQRSDTARSTQSINEEPASLEDKDKK